MVTVSVIMPAYNAGPFVAGAIDSVLAQTGVSFEVLVCDDASSDGTGAILDRYRSDDRVRLFRNVENRGAAATRNALIGGARGAYVTPCDADDLLLAGNLSRLSAYLDANPDIGAVYSSVLSLWMDDQQRLSRPPAVLARDCAGGWDLRENLVNHGGSMIRRALVEQVGGYDEDAPLVDDWSLWLKLAEVSRIAYVPGELLYVWRRHAGSLSRRDDPDRARQVEQIIRAAVRRRRE